MHVIATAGHVDHGKSTLVEALSGSNPDRLIEEQTRGLTIDLGFASTTLPSGRGVAFVDVPGHVRFLKNMLAGVGSVDACVFVVAATEGWKQQSEEHLQILTLLGINHGLVALTKVDLADSDLRELARLDIEERVHGTFLQDAPIVEVDATGGNGITALRDALDALLDSTPIATDHRRPRLWIDRVFAAKGSGTVVTGTLTGGKICLGDTIEVWPQNLKARVRALQSLHNERSKISPSNRAALNLSGVHHKNLKRGDVVVKSQQWHITKRVDCQLQVLATLNHPLTRRGAYQLYLGSGEFPVKLRILGAAQIAAGTQGKVRFHLPVGLPLLPGDRYILRESGRSETLGGGEILDVDPLLSASKAQPDRSIDRVIAERGRVDVDQLFLLTGSRRAADVGNWAVDPKVLTASQTRLVEMITAEGTIGLDIAKFNEFERAVIQTIESVDIDHGQAKLRTQQIQLKDHPFVVALKASPFSPPPPPPSEMSGAELRELVRLGELVETAGVFFSKHAVDAAVAVVANLLQEHVEGFTVAQARDRWGNSRKFALALLTHLDNNGITRRRGDHRIAGPRLPTNNLPQSSLDSE